MGEGRVVELFSDFACPFCYLAESGALRLEDAGHEVRYRAYELRPSPVRLEAPSADPAKREGWEQEIAPAALRQGLAMRFPGLAVRTRKAHEAARFARSQGVERRMRDALFAAYFADGRDIGRIDVLVEIGEALGLDRTDMKVNLDIDQYADAVSADHDDAQRLGLSGVPAYVVDVDQMSPRVAMGLQDYDGLLAWIEE